MKLKVEIAFKDKVTGDRHKPGDILTVETARGKELLKHPLKLVTVIEEKPKKKSKN